MEGLKIAQLEARIAKLRRMQFGQSPEKLAREIELAGGRRLRVSGPVETEALRRVIAVLEGR